MPGTVLQELIELSKESVGTIEEKDAFVKLHRRELFAGVRKVLDDTPVGTELADDRL